MAANPDSEPGIERQRTEIETAFRERWAPPDAGQPRVLTMPAWAEASKIINRGGQTSLDQVTVLAVRDGARPGDPLSPRQPDHYTDHVTDTEAIITGSAPGQRVAVLFSHHHFPGVRFGHRFHPDHAADARSQYFALMRDIEEGALHRLMETEPSADNSGVIWTPWGATLPGIEQQRARIEAAFRDGWRPIGGGKPRALTERAYAEARQILDHGGWTGLEQATIHAVRDDERPGDPLPPRRPAPYIDNVTDADVIITGSGPQQRVAVVFSHHHFPGVRFGHRFPPGLDGPGHPIYLKEEIETGALGRMMQGQPAADESGIVWTTWADPDQD